MSFNTPELAQPVPAVKAASQPAISKGLMIATIILTSLTAIGLFATLILLFATATNSDNEAFGWYFGFSMTASIVNVIPAAATLVLGIVSRRAKSPVSLIAIIVGAIVLLVLIGQIVFLLMA